MGLVKMCRYTKRSHARAARGFLAPNPGRRTARGLGWAVGELEVALSRRAQVCVTARATGRIASLLGERCLLGPEGLIGRGTRVSLIRNR